MRKWLVSLASSNGPRNRGNVVIGVVVVIVLLIVVAAAALFTGVTDLNNSPDDSPSEFEIAQLESELERALIERTNTFNQSAQNGTWTFTPVTTDGVIDFDRFESKLAEQGLTDQQQFWVQRVADDLLAWDTSPPITTLEPRQNDSVGATLYRSNNRWTPVSNGSPLTLSTQDGQFTDTILAVESNELGVGPGNRTLIQVDGLTIEAWRDPASVNTVLYNITYTNGTAVTQTPNTVQNTNELVFDFANDRVNGKPLGDVASVDAVQFNNTAGEPAHLRVASFNQLYPVTVSVNTVIANATGGSAPPSVTEQQAGGLNRTTVLSLAAFDVIHTDADTTSTDRITVTPEYQAYTVPSGGALKDRIITYGLAVETEDASDLRETSADDVWLPQHTVYPNKTYNISVIAKTLSGQTQRIQSPAALQVAFDAGNASCPGTCVQTANESGRLTATPKTLTDSLTVSANATVQLSGTPSTASGGGALRAAGSGQGGDTNQSSSISVNASTTVQVLDPYIETGFGYAGETVYLGQPVDAGTFTQTPRLAQYDTVKRPIANLSTIRSTPMAHIAHEMAGHYDLETEADKRGLTEALVALQQLNASERAAFKNAQWTTRVGLLELDLAPDVYDSVTTFFGHFDQDTGDPYSTSQVTPRDVVMGPQADPTDSTVRGAHSAIALLYNAASFNKPQFNAPGLFETTQALQRIDDRQQRVSGRLPESFLSQLSAIEGQSKRSTISQTISSLKQVLGQQAGDPIPRVGTPAWTNNGWDYIADALFTEIDAGQTYVQQYGYESLYEAVTSGSRNLQLGAANQILTNASSGASPPNALSKMRALLNRTVEYPNGTRLFNPPRYEDPPLRASLWNNQVDSPSVGGHETYKYLSEFEKRVYLAAGSEALVGDLYSYIETYMQQIEAFNGSVNRSLDMVLESVAPSNGDPPQLLAQDALSADGSFRLSQWWNDTGLGALQSDWTVSLQGQYNEYVFKNYSAQDTVSVTDPGKITDINVSIDYQRPEKQLAGHSGFDASPSGLNLSSSVPLITGQERSLQVDVTYNNGTTVRNPQIASALVQYNLTGPYVTPFNCNFNTNFESCVSPSGPIPTTPDDFLELDAGNLTVTATNETGQMQARFCTKINSSCTIPSEDFRWSGPISLTATLPTGQLSDSLKTSAVNVSLEPFARHDNYLISDANTPFVPVRVFVPGTFPSNKNVTDFDNAWPPASSFYFDYGITYEVHHGKLESTNRNFPNTARLEEQLTGSPAPTNGFTVPGTNSSAVSYTSDELFDVDYTARASPSVRGSAQATVALPTNANVTLTPYRLKLVGIPESSALNIGSALGLISPGETLNGTVRFRLTNGTSSGPGGGGGGGGGGSGLPFDVTGSQEGNGLFPLPGGSGGLVTTHVNAEGSPNATVDPNTPRYNRLKQPGWSRNKPLTQGLYVYDLTAGKPTTDALHAFTNLQAALVADRRSSQYNRSDLKNGTVPWRSAAGCRALRDNSTDGCTADPVGPIDYLSSGSSVGSITELTWTSSIEAEYTGSGSYKMFETNNNFEVSAFNKHTHNQFRVVVSQLGGGQAPPGNYKGKLWIEGWHKDSKTGASDYMLVNVTVPDKPDDPSDGNNLSIQSVNIPGNIDEGTTADVGVTLKNNGSSAQTETLSWNANHGASSAADGGSQSVTLSPKATKTVTFSFTPMKSGTWTHTLNFAGDSAGGTTTVDAIGSPEFDVRLSSVPAEVGAGKDFTVTVEIENTGTAKGTVTAKLSVGGSDKWSTTTDISAGNTKSFDVTTKTFASSKTDKTITATISYSRTTKTATETITVKPPTGGPGP